MEKDFVEEMMQMRFASAGGRIVHKGPLSPPPPALPPPLATAAPREDDGSTVPKNQDNHNYKKEQSACWHVLHPDAEKVRIVFIYAHIEVAELEGERGFKYLQDRLRDELTRAEKDGKLMDGRAFGIVQAGLKISFFGWNGGLWGLEARLGGMEM